MKQERVQKLIAQAGVASRREAEKLINEQKVQVNGKTIALGAKATFKDDITVNNVSIAKQTKVYYVMNKPLKTLTSLKKQDDRPLVIDLITSDEYIFPVGRLDYNTTGTLLLTNDGELAYRLMHPKYAIVRVYEAKLARNLTRQELMKLNAPDLLIDDKISWQKIRQLDDKSYAIELKQGLNHHVKKIFAHVNVDVIKLKRVAFANITHGHELPEGAYRKLKIHEIKKLKQLVNLH